MPALVRVLPVFTKKPPGRVVSTVSNAGSWSGLSPFLLGPCRLYDDHVSQNMENAWQFSKVYAEHITKSDAISEKYWHWALHGWADKRAHRYPAGKGRKPEFSLWAGRRLDYVPARKAIYAPLYAEAVQKTEAWKRLVSLYETESELTLLDYDAHDHRKIGRSLTDVLNSPDRKMGHAFVLAMLLINDPALKQIELMS